MRSKSMIAAVVAAVSIFGVLGYPSWQTKYGRGRTIGAVAAIDTIVLHQRVMGHGMRGPVAQDRLVSIDGRTGDEYARSTVLRGELVGVRDGNVMYAIGKHLVLYDARTLEGSPAPEETSAPTPTRFGAMVDLGDGILILDTLPEGDRARASRTGTADRSLVWSTELPWKGHDTKLVVQLGGNLVVVDADGIAAIDRSRGDLAWVR
jgi:hypothetical protein